MNDDDDNDDDDFKCMVAHFYEDKGDPTRYCDWDAERCKRLMPNFYFAWSQSEHFRRLADLAIKEYT